MKPDELKEIVDDFKHLWRTWNEHRKVKIEPEDMHEDLESLYKWATRLD